MRVLALCILYSIESIAALYGSYTVNLDDKQQVILGVGFEIQSDSIGSGNNGLPEVNTSVPNDLVQSEKDRFFTTMLQGFRYCRLATGLYFRGLSPDGTRTVERWPGQAAGLAEMALKSKIEGFEVEAWSPPPIFKTTYSYIDGHLNSTDPAFLDLFSDAVRDDSLYLQAHSITPVWWGLQNEPVVGTGGGCTYSCCWYNASTYYSTFKAAALKIRAALPNVVIHASSWSGQHYSPEILADPSALALVDAWTFHRVGADSDDQIGSQAYFLANASGKPVLSNEFEYLSGVPTAYRTINTAQSLMNWLTFENSPTWFWLHALKPIVNSEAATYGLGFWQPVINPSNASSLPPGHFDFNPWNWNSLSGFTKYMPWDSVRVSVKEDEVRKDNRILAFLFEPAMARWTKPGLVQPPPRAPTRETLLDASDARAAATKLGFVLTNRLNMTSFTFNLSFNSSDSSLPSFNGYLYSPTENDVPLGSVTAFLNSSVPSLSITLGPSEIQFWVQQ
jgi:O-glycosyl hydrolase